MPQVRAKIRCYVNGVLREKGEIFEFSGTGNRFVEAYVPEQPAPPAEEKAEPPRKWWNPMTWLGSSGKA